MAPGGNAPQVVARERVASARGELQSAVTGDGFLVAQQVAKGRNVLAVGRDGTHHHLAEVAREGDVRVDGTTAGPTAGYQDGRRVRLTRIADGEDLGMWGTKPRRLCDGVASNDQRFAVGWLEDDGRVWIVHGPTSRSRTSALAETLDIASVDAAAQIE